MHAFVLFALILTFGYMVYFAVMITLDIHGRKEEKKSEEETFDVSDMSGEEQPVAVEEHRDNPDTADMTYTEQITDDGLRVVNPTGNYVPTKPSAGSEQSDASRQSSSTTSTELNEANEEQMELIELLYVVYLLYAVAAIFAIIGALQIYIKMNTGEGDVTKSIMMLIGACLFMIGATVLFPAFFGYNII